jgi:hypothetical protein
LIEGEELRIPSVVARRQGAAGAFAPVDNHDVGASLALASDDLEHLRDLNLQPGLLTALADGSDSGCLVKIDESRRQAPASLVRGPGPLHQKNVPVVTGDENRGRDLVLAEDRPLAVRTVAPLPAKRVSILQTGSTLGTVMKAWPPDDERLRLSVLV